MTMQKAVGIPSENEDEEESWHAGKLEDDFIIADEFGMCDMYLADRFFSAIKKDATLVMIGDKDQLGSVGPGNVFHEMIISGMIPTTILDSCFRQEEGSTIVENAVRINRKQTRRYIDCIQKHVDMSSEQYYKEQKSLVSEWRGSDKDGN